jgi:hypothetical protein
MRARVAAAAASSSEKSGAQIFRYGTCEHAAVSSEKGDVCKATVVPRDRASSEDLDSVWRSWSDSNLK